MATLAEGGVWSPVYDGDLVSDREGAEGEAFGVNEGSVIAMESKVSAQLSHVAFLVSSVKNSSALTSGIGFSNGPAERWDGEGTLEIYVGDQSKTGLLLLMEAVQDGAYKRAFEKRGAGLHHIAVDVLDLESYILALSDSGWLLHPQSLKTMKANKTAYLARPGISTLIEVQQREKLSDKLSFVDRVEIPVPDGKEKIISALGIQQVAPSTDRQVWLRCAGVRLSGDKLCCR